MIAVTIVLCLMVSMSRGLLWAIACTGWDDGDQIRRSVLQRMKAPTKQLESQSKDSLDFGAGVGIYVP